MNRKLSTTDTLTRIGNSLYLYQNYGAYIKKWPKTHLLMIDVEKFKQINDAFGHNIGDLYLKTVAQLLEKSFVDSLVVRIHGDEFIVLTHYSEEKIKKTFSFIEEEIHRLVKEEKVPTLFRINAGSAVFDPKNIEITKEKADLMMYIAKSKGIFYQAFSDNDWKSSEKEKTFLSQFDQLLKKKEISYEQRQIYTSGKIPQNLYQIHSKNKEGTSFLDKYYDEFLRKNKRQYQLDSYNLKHLKDYLISPSYKYIIDIDYSSLLRNKEVMNYLNQYVFLNRPLNIILSIKLYPEIDREELLLLIKKIDFLKTLGFSIKINRLNPYVADAIWLEAPVDYIGIVPDFLKKTMNDSKAQYFFLKKIEMIQNYPFQAISPIFSHIDTECDAYYIQKNFGKEALVTGNYYSMGKKLEKRKEIPK